MHDRLGPPAVEIGYWCHVAHVGRGVLTRSAAALTEIALALPGVDRIEPREKLAPAESGSGMYWLEER